MHRFPKLEMTAKFMATLSVTSDYVLVSLLYVRLCINIRHLILVPAPCLPRPLKDNKDANEDLTRAAHYHDQQKTIFG